MQTEAAQGSVKGKIAKLNRASYVKMAAIIAVTILSVAGLYELSQFNYLLFHGIVESFSIVIGFTIFAIAWNSRRIINSQYFLFIGVAFLVITGLTVLHTLTYKGMGVFPGINANFATQLWISTRYLIVMAMLGALLFLNRKPYPKSTAISFAVVFALVVSSIFWWQNFPTAYVDGVGLTTFKVASEYVVSIFLLITAVLLIKNRKSFSDMILKYLVSAMVIFVAAEMSFTLYVDVYGFFNLLGHLLNVIGFYLIYKAFIETGIQKPYDLVFRNLKQNEVRLANQKEELVKTNQRLENEIIERKKAEQDLSISKRLLDNVFASMYEGVFILNKKGQVLDFNNAFTRINKFKDREDVLKSIDSLGTIFRAYRLDGAHIPVEEWPASKALGGESGTNQEFIVERTDLGVQWITSNSYAPLRDEKGEIIGAIQTMHDITERKKADVALRESEERFRIALKNAPVSVAAQDLQHRYIWAFNQKTAPSGGIIGLRDQDVFTPPEAGYFDRVKSKVIEKGVEIREQMWLNRPSGRIYLDITWSPLQDEDGAIIGVTSATVDLTAMKLAQIELEQKKEQLEETQRKLEENACLLEEYSNQMEELAKQRLEKLKDSERLAAIGATAGMVGHDIRNPLQIIVSDLYFVKKDLNKLSGKEVDTIKESLSSIELSVNYINKIVQDLQDYAKPIKLSIEELNIQALCNDVLKKINTPSGISAECFADEGTGILLTDQNILRRILTNLLNNAIQAMPNGGKVTLSAKKEKDEVIITVTDTGLGIPKEIKDKLFTPLFTTKSKGQGFGLAVVKRMTEALGGTVAFDSEEGKGTVFKIHLPANPPLDH